MALGTKYHGIRDLKAVRDRCRVVKEPPGVHWIWRGAITVSTGLARMYGPLLHEDGTRTMEVQNGRRVVWQLKTGKPIPKGYRLFCTCGEELCLHPTHMVCRTSAEHGQILRETGEQRGLPSKIAANRKIALTRSNVTAESYRLVLTSKKTGIALVDETGICRSTISRIRTGKFKSLGDLSLVASPFSGLGERDAQR